MPRYFGLGVEISIIASVKAEASVWAEAEDIVTRMRPWYFSLDVSTSTVGISMS